VGPVHRDIGLCLLVRVPFGAAAQVREGVAVAFYGRTHLKVWRDEDCLAGRHRAGADSGAATVARHVHLARVVHEVPDRAGLAFGAVCTSGVRPGVV
jgi:hypothetical protein